MKTKLVLACALGSAWRLRPLPQATTLSRTPRPINARSRRQSRPRKARPWSWSATVPLMPARRKRPRPWGVLTLASRPDPDQTDHLNRVETRRGSRRVLLPPELPLTAIRQPVFHAAGGAARPQQTSAPGRRQPKPILNYFCWSGTASVPAAKDLISPEG